jgi:TM2 domain-containing membrane protein YozV
MKSVGVAYVLWFFLGWAGVHRFYCNRTGSGLLWLFSFGVFFFGWFIDLFLIPGMVTQANLEYAALMRGGGHQIQQVSVNVQAPNAEAPRQSAADTRDCPHCGETIKMKANVCRFCHNKVEPPAGIRSPSAENRPAQG